MADHEEVMKGIERHTNTTYAALAPNTKGFNSAVSIVEHLWLLVNIIILIDKMEIALAALIITNAFL